MPEIVEVEIITTWLDKHHRGCIIRNASHYTDVINNTVIDNVSRKGKQIFFRLNNRGTLFYLNSRLGLQGKWSHSPGNNTRFWLELEKQDIIIKDNKFELITENLILYNDDSQNFGDVELLSEKGYQNKLRKIGPDFLNDKITLEMWMNKLKYKRISNKQICDFLLEQSYFSGIGNYLKADILYHSKIKPDRTLNTLTDLEIETLLNSSFYIIGLAYKYGGLTIKSFWSPDGAKGMYPTLVYNRKTDSYGNKVEKSHFDDNRTTHWVPAIQR